jgi:hypothetical protein
MEPPLSIGWEKTASRTILSFSQDVQNFNNEIFFCFIHFHHGIGQLFQKYRTGIRRFWDLALTKTIANRTPIGFSQPYPIKSCWT